MNHSSIIDELSKNGEIFSTLLYSVVTKSEYTWKPAPEKWCMLEVVCHLLDEEREDFSYRVKHTLDTPTLSLPPIDPQGWVSQRDYMGQDYKTTLRIFLDERANSISWLRSLTNPKWDNVHNHSKLGPISAEAFLSNWLAHDYLHMRQIISLKFHYWKEHTGQTLEYAGTW